MKRFLGIKLLALTLLFACQSKELDKVLKEIEASKGRRSKGAWMYQDPRLWKSPLPASKKDSHIPLPKRDLNKEGIGRRETVANLFERWILNESVRDSRMEAYAEITKECKGLVEVEFAIDPKQWAIPGFRLRYYKNVEKLIESVASKLLPDFGNSLQNYEKVQFIRALKALSWQESRWQHYLRYKNWFFVALGAGPVNQLGDWGITQIARSGFKKSHFLNQSFFNSKGYCSIYSSLYYGFLEFYFNYMEARQDPCNGDLTKNKLLGAYNRYFSGFSTCHKDFSKTSEYYRNLQIESLKNFEETFENMPWREIISNLD